MDFKFVLCEEKDGIGTIVLNRPDKLNAMHDGMFSELGQALENMEANIDTKAIVIKGAGRGFSVGQDLREKSGEMVPQQPGAYAGIQDAMLGARRRARFWEYVFNLCKPTIAQVHGYCLGSALSLAMSCDLAVAAEDATVGDPSVRMGILPDSPLWLWHAGQKKARAMIFTGRTIDGKKAESLGLVNQAVPFDMLDEAVRKLAEAMSLLPVDGLTVTKDCINGTLEARGVGAAWRFTTDIQLALQKNRIRPGEFDFFSTLNKAGLREALKQRDAGLKF